MEELKVIIDKLKKIKIDTELNIPDSILLEQAVDIFLSRQIGKQQDKRAGIVDKTKIKEPNAPATEGQITYYARLGGNTNELDPKVTKGEMSKKIEEQLKKTKQSAEGYL